MFNPLRLIAFSLAVASPLPGLAADVTAHILDNSGAQIGSVTLKGNDKLALLRVEVQPGSLTPGWHGMHLHAVADCSDIEAFKAAKAHVNHGTGEHGLLNPAGPESGDLPNLFVAADGSATAEIATSLAGLTGDHGLLDSDGSALIIHAAEDDHATQPIGNSGDRLACAALQ